MATLKERPDTYSAGGIIKRDFQHDHSGPEEMPHRKKKNNNRGAKRGDHKHIWETNGWEKKFHWRFVSGDGFVRDPNRYYLIRRYECLECGKAGNREYDWSGRSM